MISGSSIRSEFNKNNNNNKAEICATVCNVLCVQRNVAHFKGSVNALQKCCATVARHLRVRVCVCAHLWSMSSSSFCYCKLAVFCNANAKQMAIGNSRLAIGNSPAQHAACCLLSATCHLPRHLVTVSVSPSGAKFK